MILPPFQIISRFDFFGISVFATHLCIIIYQFYSVVSRQKKVLFSCQCNCKSRLVSFIQLSVHMQIMPCQFYSAVSTIANHNSASKLKNCSSVSQVLFSSVYL